MSDSGGRVQASIAVASGLASVFGPTLLLPLDKVTGYIFSFLFMIFALIFMFTSGVTSERLAALRESRERFRER